jgi:hypothetical protein
MLAKQTFLHCKKFHPVSSKQEIEDWQLGEIENSVLRKCGYTKSHTYERKGIKVCHIGYSYSTIFGLMNANIWS